MKLKQSLHSSMARLFNHRVLVRIGSERREEEERNSPDNHALSTDQGLELMNLHNESYFWYFPTFFLLYCCVFVDIPFWS